MGNKMLGLWLSQALILRDYNAGLEAAIRVFLYTAGSNAPICKYSFSEQNLEDSHYDWHHLASSQEPRYHRPGIDTGSISDIRNRTQTVAETNVSSIAVFFGSLLIKQPLMNQVLTSWLQ